MTRFPFTKSRTFDLCLLLVAALLISALVAWSLWPSWQERWFSTDQAVPHRINGTIGDYIADLSSTNALVRIHAIESLASMGSPAVPEVKALLKDDSSALRRDAALILGRMAKEAESAAPELLDALNDYDKHVCAEVIGALNRIGPLSEAQIPSLTEAMLHGDCEVRKPSLEMLIQFGRPAVPVFMKELKDADAGRRTQAAMALGRIGQAAEEAIVDLQEATDDPDRSVAAEAKRALDSIVSDGNTKRSHDE